MTPQATNRREGGLRSCRGRSRKELETVGAVNKLLGVLTTGQVEILGMGRWLRELKEANKAPISAEYTKTEPKMLFFFTQKYFIRYTSKIFLRNM
jgi:hypothetical protein